VPALSKKALLTVRRIEGLFCSLRTMGGGSGAGYVHLPLCDTWLETSLMSSCRKVRTLKTVRQKHRASAKLLQLLDEFRRMVNVCVTVGIEENVSSLKTLSTKSYHRLSHDILGYYRLGAISAATGILRNHRKTMKKNPRTRAPCARRLMLTTCYGFKVQSNQLRLPIKPQKYVYVKLNNRTLKVLSGFNVRSVALTPESISISYSKEMVEIEPVG